MKQIFKTIVGSQLYGTNLPTSDVDYKSIYIQPIKDVLSFNKYKPQIDYDKDSVGFEIGRFMELIAKGNPNIVELLFVPNNAIIETSEEYNTLVSYRSMFLTKKLSNSYAGYAFQQIEKARGLNKKMNWDENRITRKTPLDFCYLHMGNEDSRKLRPEDVKNLILSKVNNFPGVYSVYWVEDAKPFYNSDGLILSEAPEDRDAIGLVYYNADAFSIHCKEYNSYVIWEKERNEERYKTNKSTGQGLDSKNIMHCVRLIQQAKEIVETGNIVLPCSNVDYLIKIRLGEVDLQDILEQSEKDIKEIQKMFKDSDLPNDVDLDLLNDLLFKIRTNEY